MNKKYKNSKIFTDELKRTFPIYILGMVFHAIVIYILYISFIGLINKYSMIYILNFIINNIFYELIFYLLMYKIEEKNIKLSRW